MKIRRYTDAAPEEVAREVFDGVKARYVITDKEGAPYFAMRVFEFEPGGHTSFHQHPEEHEIFILEVEVTAVNDHGEEATVEPGHPLFIPPNDPHLLNNVAGRGVPPLNS